ncbi:FUN14 domain-containing protein 1 isoform X1 [Erinaceus europaeus]|uniref:FUN14 domain-containing protein 1 isoform X1 n=1 Tax=Erinaceus europaeus TaxID=9365 RepID=A0ABM3WPL1_ERIEU|nr:FUN14 domain-containing protein 1 isoform X1 [Erinaceus europaeus]
MATRNPPPQEYESDDDSYEVLDLTEYARRHHWWNRVFGHSSGPMVEKYSVATQIVMGGVTGWCAGFLFQKVGKLAATAVGGGFLLLQVASHSGYVQIDWKRVEKDVNKAKRQIKKRANKAAPEINNIIEEDYCWGERQRRERGREERHLQPCFTTHETYPLLGGTRGLNLCHHTWQQNLSNRTLSYPVDLWEAFC